MNKHAASRLCTHGVSNVGGVTAGSARLNSSNVGCVTAGQMEHISSTTNNYNQDVQLTGFLVTTQTQCPM